MLNRIVLMLFLVLSASLLAYDSGCAQEWKQIETFDDPTLPGWELSPEVGVSEGVLQVGANGFAFRGARWSDLTLTIRARRMGDGALTIQYRATDTGSYVFSFGNEYAALRREEARVLTDVATAPVATPEAQWVEIGITVAGDVHTITLDGATVISVTDHADLPPGGVILRAEGGASGEFDDLVLTVSGVAAQITPAPAVSPAAGVPAYQAGRWERTGGPPGGLGYDIRMQPDNPDIMYVTDAYAGVHKSVDGGRTWFPVNSGIFRLANGEIPVFSLTIDPHDYNTIWVGTQVIGHVYRSTDGGKTWAARDSGVINEGRNVRGITIDPHDPNTVYLGVEVSSFAWAHRVISKRHDLTKGEVYKSSDAGLTWTRIWEGNNLARYIWVDPRNSNRLYVSTGIFDRDAADSDVPNGVWGGVGILRSDDGGQTWTILDERNGLGGRYVGSLFMHPINPDILLAAVTGTGERPGAYVTYDGGDTWVLSLDSQGWGIEAVEVATSDPNVWYAAGEGRIWRSDDGGQTWQGHYRIGTADRDAGVPIDLQVDPRDPYRIFVNNYGGGNFLSEDGGVTWVDASQGYTGLKVAEVAVLPTDAQTVFAGPFRSVDGGQTWVGIEARAARSFRFYPVPGSATPGLIIGDTAGRVWHSEDGGETLTSTWVIDLLQEAAAGRVFKDVESMRALAVAPSDPLTVYVGFSDVACIEGWLDACFRATAGFFRSHDGGHTWESVKGTPFDGVSILRIAVHPQDSRMLFAGTAYGLFRSADGGTTWQRVESLAIDPALVQMKPDLAALQLDRPIIYDIVFDPFTPATLYAASSHGAVWRSVDGGQTWTQAAAGMDPNEPVYHILPDPNRRGVLYVSSALSGVFYSTDGAQTWIRLADGLDNANVRGLALSDDGSVLYAGTFGAGVYRLGIPNVMTP